MLVTGILAGCQENASGTGSGSESATESVAVTAQESEAALEDGTYSVDVDTGSNMFHVNETKDGKGVLTVKDGEMTVHIVLASKNIVNVFYGVKEDAEKDGADLIEPVEEEVTYSDGITDTAYAFDIPVPALDQEYPVSIIGTHGKWYEHQMKVSNPEPAEF